MAMTGVMMCVPMMRAQENAELAGGVTDTSGAVIPLVSSAKGPKTQKEWFIQCCRFCRPHGAMECRPEPGLRVCGERCGRRFRNLQMEPSSFQAHFSQFSRRHQAGNSI